MGNWEKIAEKLDANFFQYLCKKYKIIQSVSGVSETETLFELLGQGLCRSAWMGHRSIIVHHVFERNSHEKELHTDIYSTNGKGFSLWQELWNVVLVTYWSKCSYISVTFLVFVFSFRQNLFSGTQSFNFSLVLVNDKDNAVNSPLRSYFTTLVVFSVGLLVLGIFEFLTF